MTKQTTEELLRETLLMLIEAAESEDTMPNEWEQAIREAKRVAALAERPCWSSRYPARPGAGRGEGE